MLIKGALLLLLLLLSLLFSLKLGTIEIGFAELIGVLSGEPSDATLSAIVLELRAPRTLLAALAGAGLALSGAILQSITRNPLADPYLFGLSSGASFGVVLVLTILGSAGAWSVSMGAFGGSLLATLLLVLITAQTRLEQRQTMVLAGVVLSFLFSAMTSLLLYFSEPQASSSLLFWSLGSFTRASWDGLWGPMVGIIACACLLLLLQRPLNALLLGDEAASTLGLNVAKFRLLMLAVCALMTALVVSQCGGIGFVGLMVPHIVRHFVYQTSPFGLISIALFGAMFMLWIDIASRLIIPNQTLPIGILTASIGSLFFISLLYLKPKVAK